MRQFFVDCTKLNFQVIAPWVELPQAGKYPVSSGIASLFMISFKSSILMFKLSLKIFIWCWLGQMMDSSSADDGFGDVAGVGG